MTCHCDSEELFTFPPWTGRQGGSSGGVAHAQGRVHPCWQHLGLQRLSQTGEEVAAAGHAPSRQSPTPPEIGPKPFAKAIWKSRYIKQESRQVGATGVQV